MSNTNIYFGGVGKPDGLGHGHYVMDPGGNVTYRRDPFDPHGAQNFEPGGKLYDRRARRDTLPLGVRNRDNDTNDRSGVFYDRNRQVDLHVTQYYGDNYRVSWDTDGNSDQFASLICSEIAVMYAGEIVEKGPAKETH